MTDLTEFLLARVAEDEARARTAAGAAPEPWEVADRGWMARLYRAGSDQPILEVEQDRLAEPVPGALLEHIAAHGPARVLAECAAKRRIIELHDDALKHEMDFGEQSALGADLMHSDVLQLLALPYADHADYRSEWTP